MPALESLTTAYLSIRRNREFQQNLTHYLSTYVGRPTPLTYAKNISQDLGFSIYLKREDLNHTGAHKINNALGQILLAIQMGKKRIIAETGAGQHGVATATAAALMGLKCDIYMGQTDVDRQKLNVHRMQLLGARVIPVTSGSQTLKDATSEAIRDWLTNVRDTHYIIGSVVGPHPYPMMVRDFQSVIGKEAKTQIRKETGQLPTAIVACVGGGSNAAGIFSAFIRNKSVQLFGVEAGGDGILHAASLSAGTPGILHGAKSYLLQTPTGQIQLAHSISAGLDYPGVGPELAHWVQQNRLIPVQVSDTDALSGCQWMASREGIIPALETAHAIAWVKTAPFAKDAVVLLNISGRGDKDMETLVAHIGTGTPAKITSNV